MKGLTWLVLGAVALALGGAAECGAQEERPLSLDEALVRAVEANAELGTAAARARAAGAEARGASSFLWPTVALRAGAVRTDDPVAAFGTKLRQGRFREADFALDALNDPAAVNDLSFGAGAEWGVLDPGAWTRREAAAHGALAAELQVDRTREAILFQTRVLYLRAVQARARVRSAGTALEAAEANLGRVTSRRDRGLLTDADVLRARAEVEGARASVEDARALTTTSRSRLAVHLGWDGDVLPLPTDSLLLEDAADEVGDAPPLERRADLRALEAQRRMASALRTAAARSRLPALEAFVALDSYGGDASGPFRESWTVGVRVEVPLFTGFGIAAAVDGARAREQAASLRSDEARRRARSEVVQARQGVESGRQAVEAARAASSAAREAARLVRRRYQEGMATTTDLLQAESRAAEFRVRAIDASAAYRIALARLDFALGSDDADQPTRDESRRNR